MTDVDPKTRMLLDLMAALGEPPLSAQTVEDFRARRARGREIISNPSPELPVIRDIEVAGHEGPLRARLYDSKDGPPRPALIYFHGGGFVYGDIESHDSVCRRLAHHGGFRVISVDYRLAPEAPFPAPVDDAIAAIAAIAGRAADYGVDARRLAVGGDSAGACLATVAARHLRRTGGPALAFQLLIYPVTQASVETESRRKFAEGYFLTTETMAWFDGLYLPNGADRSDERIAPLLTAPPAGLAPALIITAGFDPLRDEGLAYAEALTAAGIDVRYREYPDQIHGFASFTKFSGAAEKAIEDAARTVAAALS
jgi:acetyl esterase